MVSAAVAKPTWCHTADHRPCRMAAGGTARAEETSGLALAAWNHDRWVDHDQHQPQQGCALHRPDPASDHSFDGAGLDAALPLDPAATPVIARTPITFHVAGHLHRHDDCRTIACDPTTSGITGPVHYSKPARTHKRSTNNTAADGQRSPLE